MATHLRIPASRMRSSRRSSSRLAVPALLSPIRLAEGVLVLVDELRLLSSGARSAARGDHDFLAGTRGGVIPFLLRALLLHPDAPLRHPLAKREEAEDAER